MTETKPKRRWFVPQFSLRLMLLIVALAATIFGWRAAVNEEHRPDRMRQRESLQRSQRQLETHIEQFKRLLQKPDRGRSVNQNDIQALEKQLSQVKEEIEALSP